MSKKYYRIVLYTINLAAIIYVLCFWWWYSNVYTQDKSRLAPKYYDDVIINQNTAYSATDQNSSPYEVSFMKIKNISFYSNDDFVYLRFVLGGTLPESAKALPKYYGDKLTSIVYNVTLDENYFDLLGNKNPTNPEARLRIDMYGNSPSIDNSGKINVAGELIKGGAGYDYFIVRYPYRDVLFNQRDDYIVFTANSVLTSEKYPDGASVYGFENNDLAITPQNNKEIRIDLSLKDLIY